MRYELFRYDVVGNPREGYEVNDIYATGRYAEIPEDASDAEIVRILKEEGIIRKRIPAASIEIEGVPGYTLYFTHRPTGRPAFELRPAVWR